MTPEGQLTCAAQLTAKHSSIPRLVTPFYHAESTIAEKAEARFPPSSKPKKPLRKVFKGIDFDSIDDKPVHIIFMIATPEEYYDTFHVRMLSNIAKLMSKSPNLKDRIIEADSPEEIFEILQNKELEKFNPFFED